MADTTRETDLAIIGGGPGGYTAAFLAADRGVRTAIVEPRAQLGGVCLNCGCIPSKTLLHFARLVGEANEAAAHGVKLALAGLDLNRLRQWKNEVISKNASGLRQLAKARNVEILQNRAEFIDSQTLGLCSPEGPGNDGRLRFNRAIIATGSRPADPGLVPFGGRIMDATAALDLPDIPESLLVIGGGYIGLEIGTIYAALGSRVTVVEMTADLLPGVDRDLVRILQTRLKKTFTEILLRTRVTSLTDLGSTVAATIEPDGGTPPSRQTFDRVLVAVGRTPNSEDLGLERTAVRRNSNGFLEVDHLRRTADERVYAIGDVVGQPMLAHKASHEARVAIGGIVGRPAAPDSRAIPAVVFTDPEVAWAGLSETEAAARGVTVEVTRFPWAASGRAATIGRSEGLTKILLAPDDKRVLGAGIVGVGAGELIAEAVLAIETRATAQDLARCIHAHPTLSETLGEAAELATGTTPHLFRPRR